jgi:glycosyltransferase involved in cell wall biosynthesis
MDTEVALQTVRPTDTLTGLRIALCHEWFTRLGGSEIVAKAIVDTFGIQDVYTFAASAELTEQLIPSANVRASTWGSSSLARRHWEWFLPVMPIAWSRMRLSSYDVVITSAHAFTNWAHASDTAVHISYCHTPMRYAWEWRSEIKRFPIAIRPMWPLVAAMLRRGDARAARRPDAFIANSAHVADRIRARYQRPAHVVYPPIDTDYWTPATDGAGTREFFLLAGRMVAYKHPEVAVRAAVSAGVPVVIAGAGPEFERMRRDAPAQTTFVDRPSRSELRELYRNARALLNPGVEDFGMTMVEAQACGTPVIAKNAGGAKESVIPGVTGILYEDGNVAALASVLKRFDTHRYSADAVRANSLRFGRGEFSERMRDVVDSVVRERRG